MARKRKPGSGMLRQRNDGRWEGRVVVDYDEKGLPVTRNVTAKTKAACQEKLNKLKAECGKAAARAREDITLGEWLDMWYKTYSKPTLRPNTQKCYEDRIYLHIIPAIGKIRLSKLQQSDIQQFYADLKMNGRLVNMERYGPGLSDRAVRACHTTCRAALEKAVEEGLIPSNPAAHCKLPPKKTGEMQILTHDEMWRFLIQAKEDGFYELALLELSTGMRRGEVCALKWDDIDFKTGQLHIRRQVCYTKGGLQISVPKTKSSDRIMILPPTIVNVLQKYKGNSKDEWLFPSPVNEGNPIDPQSVYRKMRKALDRAGCKKIRFHDLRHTFATMALEHGMDIKTLSAIIGTYLPLRLSTSTATSPTPCSGRQPPALTAPSAAFSPLYQQKTAETTNPSSPQTRHRGQNLSPTNPRSANPALVASMS